MTNCNLPINTRSLTTRKVKHNTHLSLLKSTSLSMPCEVRRTFAASRLLPRTSLSVLRTDTTVSSDRFRPDWPWPPGRLDTRWGVACKPTQDNTHTVSNFSNSYIKKQDCRRKDYWNQRLKVFLPRQLRILLNYPHSYQAVHNCDCRWQGFLRLQTLLWPRDRCHDPVALPSREDQTPDAQWHEYSDHTKKNADGGSKALTSTLAGLFL